MQSRSSLPFAFGIVLFVVIMRLVPHPWNMTPLAATAILAGTKLGPRMAILLPLAAMFASDLVIGFYQPATMAVVYGSMIAIGLASYLTRAYQSRSVFLARPLLASLFFFATTNAAVAFFGTMYPHTLGGLIASYAAGLPFLTNDLIGNLLYTPLVFAAFELYSQGVASLSRRRSRPEGASVVVPN